LNVGDRWTGFRRSERCAQSAGDRHDLVGNL
jgi:hypothetical protein